MRNSHEKLRADYSQREAAKHPDLSWKAFYQRVAGRDGLLGVVTGYKTLQLIGVIGFLSNVVVIPRGDKSFNLAGLYWKSILDICAMDGGNHAPIRNNHCFVNLVFSDW